jgi:hypothetical protein
MATAGRVLLHMLRAHAAAVAAIRAEPAGAGLHVGLVHQQITFEPEGEWLLRTEPGQALLHSSRRRSSRAPARPGRRLVAALAHSTAAGAKRGRVSVAVARAVGRAGARRAHAPRAGSGPLHAASRWTAEWLTHCFGWDVVHAWLLTGRFEWRVPGGRGPDARVEWQQPEGQPACEWWVGLGASGLGMAVSQPLDGPCARWVGQLRASLAGWASTTTRAWCWTGSWASRASRARCSPTWAGARTARARIRAWQAT